MHSRSKLFLGACVLFFAGVSFAQTPEAPPLVPDAHPQTTAKPKSAPKPPKKKTKRPVAKKKRPVTKAAPPPAAEPSDPTPPSEANPTKPDVKRGEDVKGEPLKAEGEDAKWFDPNERYRPRAVDEIPKEDPFRALTKSPDRWFLGAHYQPMLLPTFLLSPFARASNSLLFHRMGVQLEAYKASRSLVFGLDFLLLSSPRMLLGSNSSTDTGNFGEKFSDVGYFSAVESSMKAVSANFQYLWNAPISSGVTFQFGFGIGVAFTFGTLTNNWVFENDKGTLTYGSKSYSECRTVFDGKGCRPQDHAEPLPTRVWSGTGAPYEEKSWFSGGKRPVFLPDVMIPVGLRFALGDSLALTTSAGISFTGFFLNIGLAANVAGDPPKTEPLKEELIRAVPETPDKSSTEKAAAEKSGSESSPVVP